MGILLEDDGGLEGALQGKIMKNSLKKFRKY